MTKILIKSLLLTLLATIITTKSAFAYIDPATGGMLFQALATALAVLAGFALVFSRQIRMLFARVKRSLRGESAADEQPLGEAQSAPQNIDAQDEG